ncbi:Hypothetical protein D9617_11g008000 [Elsinoe fawcettii]|nr:Hypothetical protein D9617_11g008000 [Elsinoe fawcettii]
MEDPVKEIPTIISLLTTTPPSTQLATINKYFTPSATFVHPFCRTPITPDSRWHLSRIYRWYKIMSPRISIQVHSVAFDEPKRVLYVGISQVFAIWLVPFHRAKVSLVTVLHLERREGEVLGGSSASMSAQGRGARQAEGTREEGEGEGSMVHLDLDAGREGKAKWYISSQNDLYQTDQFLRFVVPQLAWVMELWQLVATWVCVLCSYLFEPVTWWEETRQRDFKRKEEPPVWNDGIGGSHFARR